MMIVKMIGERETGLTFELEISVAFFSLDTNPRAYQNIISIKLE